jgi:hypothetical protein
MVLANGQYAFTCSGDGSFQLDVPIDNNDQVTFYTFCAGQQPYKYIYKLSEISLTDDSDGDGFTIAVGDCNDLDANISPWGNDFCGDGIDQDCSGSDFNCPDSNGTITPGLWAGKDIFFNVKSDASSIENMSFKYYGEYSDNSCSFTYEVTSTPPIPLSIDNDKFFYNTDEVDFSGIFLDGNHCTIDISWNENFDLSWSDYYSNCNGTYSGSRSLVANYSFNPTNIPYARISIDGDFWDWSDVPFLIQDLSGDVYGEAIDLLKAYLARDDEYIYFMIETDTDLDSLLAPNFACSFIFNSRNSSEGREFRFGHYLDSTDAGIANIDNDVPGGGIPLMEYPESFASHSGKKFEAKALIKDMNSKLLNMDLTVRLRDAEKNGDDFTQRIELN